MMQTQQSAYHLKYKNCRRIPSHTSASGTSTVSSKCTTISDNASDIIDADYVDKHIPKMELLKINYVNKTAPNDTKVVPARKSIATIEDKELVQLRAKKRLQARQNARSHSVGELKIHELAKLSIPNDSQPKQSASHERLSSGHVQQSSHPQYHQHPLKYAVYKKHNPQDFSKDVKLQYTNDDAFFKSKKKYLAFESKKRSGLDNIQFYFDSKSYERHVDNKMYGVLSGNHHQNDYYAEPINSRTSSNGECKSSSWNFVKATKSFLNGANAIKMSTDNKNTKKMSSSKKMLRESSLGDVSRVGQLFKEVRRASADDILDAPERIMPERKMSSDNPPLRDGSTEKIRKLINSFEEQCTCEHKIRNDKVARPSDKKTNLLLPIYSVPYVNNSKVKEANQTAHKDKVNHSNKSVPANAIVEHKEKSYINIGHGKRLFGNFQTNYNAKSSCGYKNCTFVNCPMSSAVSSSASSCSASSSASSVGDEELCQKSTNTLTNDEVESKVKAIQNISITKINIANNNNNNNKSDLYLKMKDLDENEHFSAIAMNNLKNLKNTTTNSNGNTFVSIAGTNDKAGGTTIPIKFSPSNQNLNNSMKCKSVEKLDFNSTSTIENRKLNNISTSLDSNAVNDSNRVKIFICNPPTEALCGDTPCNYYDTVPAEDTDDVARKNNDDDDDDEISLFKKKLQSMGDDSVKHLSHLFPSRLGCDGAIFWNDCYYYDEQGCYDCDVEHNGDDIENDKDNGGKSGNDNELNEEQEEQQQQQEHNKCDCNIYANDNFDENDENDNKQVLLSFRLFSLTAL